MTRFLSRIRHFLAPARIERDLAREIEAHLALLEDGFRERGMSDAEARRAARLALGGADQTKERHRDARSFLWLDDLRRDVHYAFRSLRRTPGFTVVAILMLALGIGANTAIFGLIDALLLHSIPVRNPEQLVAILRVRNGQSGQHFNYPTVQRLEEHRELFDGLCGFSGDTFNVGPPDGSEPTSGAWVSGGFYSTLGLTPIAGRLLGPDDDRLGAAPVAVITDRYWNRRFARHTNVLGQPLLVEGVPVTIVGVSPPGFVGTTVGETADITLALSVLPQLQPERAGMIGPGGRWLRILARPVAGLPPEQLRARLAVLWTDSVTAGFTPTTTAEARRNALFETIDTVSGATGTSLLRDQYRKPLYLLMAMVGFVLLVACANVANLLFARALVRQREIAVRLAIGASRGRIVRQLLTEGACLAGAGTVFGIGLAAVSGPGLLRLISGAAVDPGVNGIALDLSPNTHVLAFTIAAAVLTTLMFSLAPAFRASRPIPTLAASLSATSARMPKGRVGSVLVVVQVAISLLLLIGGGLFIRTLLNLRTLDPGFRREGVLLVHVDARRSGYDRAGLRTFNQSVVTFAEDLPGVRAASLSLVPPLLGGGISLLVEVNGKKIEGAIAGESPVNIVAPRYFETLGTPVLRGREFTSGDDDTAPRVVVVNEAFAQRYLPAGDPLMQRVSVIGFGPLSSRNAVVVGVVKDAVYERLRDAPPPTVYAPYAQMGGGDVTVEVHVAGPVAEVASAIRKEIQPKLPPTAPPTIQTMTEQLERGLVQERVMAVLGATFGGLALVLAAVGLYGLLSYVVVRRTNEIGVRMALGAERRDVMWVVMRDALRMLALGVALGLPMAWAVSRVASSLLFGLSPNDPITEAIAAVLLVCVGLVAGFFPARRATLVNPLAALRSE